MSASNDLPNLILPPHVDGIVGERADAIGVDLAGWLDGNVGPDDARAAGVAMLRLAIELHIEVMGKRRAFAHLSEMLHFMSAHG